jgi:hypothetical protein
MGIFEVLSDSRFISILAIIVAVVSLVHTQKVFPRD